MFVWWWGLLVAGFPSGFTERSINISNAWFLPREGFPVFYRYFSERVTWNEAQAICSLHRADLLSVASNIEMDASRAYLKEMDVVDNVWIALRKEPDEDTFSWGNGEAVAEGYWTGPIPKSEEVLCVAIDPVFDFRWSTFFCGGPQVASFVCELPVPEWAKKKDGCIISSLPSLTVTLMPETDVIQLYSDCGSEGTRRMVCKGDVNQEDLMRRLSCDFDVFPNPVINKSSTKFLKEGKKEGTGYNGRKDIFEENMSQETGTRDIFLLRTRHRRNADLNRQPEILSLERKKIKSPPAKARKRGIEEAEKKVKIKNSLVEMTDTFSASDQKNFPASFLERNGGVTETDFEIFKNKQTMTKWFEKNAFSPKIKEVNEISSTPENLPATSSSQGSDLRREQPKLAVTEKKIQNNFKRKTSPEDPRISVQPDQKAPFQGPKNSKQQKQKSIQDNVPQPPTMFEASTGKD